MKTHILIPAVAAALLCAAFITSNAYMRTDKTQKPDGQGHILGSLWKEYYDAQKADKPLKMAAALEKIRKEASSKRLHWDFYDAVSRKMQAELSRNWKLRDSLQKQLSADVEAYGEPIVTYSHRKDNGAGDLLDYVLSTGSRLQAGRNPQFYSRIGGQMNGLLTDCVKDDYEYALWSEFGDWRGRDRAGKVLKDYIGDTYPNAAWLEFRSIENKAYDSRIPAYEEFAGKYAGKAVNLFAKAHILQDAFMKLNSKKADEKEYKELLTKVKAAEKDGFSCNEYFCMESGNIHISGVEDDGIQVEVDSDIKTTGTTDEHEDENSGNFYAEAPADTAEDAIVGTITISDDNDGKAIKVDGKVVLGKHFTYHFDTSDIKEGTPDHIATAATAQAGTTSIYHLDGRQVSSSSHPRKGIVITRNGKQTKKIMTF